MFDVRAVDLRLLNSLTKYPSIATYHTLEPGSGCLAAPATVFPGEVVATEKVDGTNSRLVLLPDGSYLIGSREELLYAKGDLIGNPALGIVEQLKPVAERLPRGAGIRVYYLELYGGKVGGAAKQYTRDPARFGWRLFDVAELADWQEPLTWSPAKISAWRESGGQPWLPEDALVALAAQAGLELTPRLWHRPGAELPAGIEDMHQLLTATLPATLVGLDGAEGRAEGLVLRAPDRSVIAKARFQDYERTLRRRR
ncbi:RNA ligase family protein [Dactylosporangium aurantiacum]|nr:RNA ligase family protein [Dactylosporangium aurantiacum]MDG6104639.1 RNA ligase family protein [Dactylosporangium aurantiacum]